MITDPSWMAWLSQAWPELSRRGRLCAPAGLPHPSLAGFDQPWLTEPAGQVADWVASFDDGTRVHLHEYADGSIVAHRDALDPNQGLIRTVGHFFFETTTGRIALYGLLGFGMASGLAKLGLGYHRVPLTKILPAAV